MTAQQQQETTGKPKIVNQSTVKPVMNLTLYRLTSSKKFHHWICTISAFIIFTLLASCRASTFFPLTGATVGGGVGSLGGPLTGALGAGAGYSVGVIAQGDDRDRELTEVKEKVEAISTGDVERLVQMKLEENNIGFFDQVMNEVWGLLKLSAVAVGLWILVPIIYSRYLHKKQKENK